MEMDLNSYLNVDLLMAIMVIMEAEELFRKAKATQLYLLMASTE
jgi:hypothetical protein